MADDANITDRSQKVPQNTKQRMPHARISCHNVYRSQRWYTPPNIVRAKRALPRVTDYQSLWAQSCRKTCVLDSHPTVSIITPCISPATKPNLQYHPQQHNKATPTGVTSSDILILSNSRTRSFLFFLASPKHDQAKTTIKTSTGNLMLRTAVGPRSRIVLRCFLVRWSSPSSCRMTLGLSLHPIPGSWKGHTLVGLPDKKVELLNSGVRFIDKKSKVKGERWTSHQQGLNKAADNLQVYTCLTRQHAKPE